MAYGSRGFAMRSYSDGTGAVPGGMFGIITPTGAVVLVGSFRRVAWQIDENVGVAVITTATVALQLDEDVLALTALLSRDGALQADEYVLVKPAIPVTSY